MLIAYDSKTGNVKRFINRLNLRAVQIEEQMTIDEPFLLVTYTTGFGQIPERVSAFLKRNFHLMRGVAASGNRNWGANFARSADLIAQQYRVPIIGKFELSGTRQDILSFESEVNRVAAH
ncbi:class Ib ribonucleoside-diphosphate reductase assembly flavoprotein NrdI [Paenibacillus sp. 1P07SE]|uniref:class Ib ribonucleoside-diphosphate reductase assembly flavoprotein NrdI n=1 Tax=Paenibacillus sp. 1P07SE TaxID=3132209 RepID=UPI0039A5B237